MAARILDGKLLAREIQSEIREQAEAFKAAHGVTPTLGVILVGDDPASGIYVKQKRRACERTSLGSRMVRLPADTDGATLLAAVQTWNQDQDVHGILVQLPLPNQVETASVLDAISPAKDVDGFHPENMGRLMQGRPRFVPPTPAGVLQILRRNDLETTGQRIVILGRSDIVGKPLAALLLRKDTSGNATVTVCHRHTKNLAEITRSADILVAAMGQPRYVTTEMVRPGATVIDVGTNRTEAGLVGDVDFEAVREVAGHLTPVPGGVGPMTVTMLLHNTLLAASEQLGIHT